MPAPSPYNHQPTTSSLPRPSRSNRLDWPAGAESKKSVRAVGKLRRLRDHLRLHADPESLRPCMDTLVDLVGYSF